MKVIFLQVPNDLVSQYSDEAITGEQLCKSFDMPETFVPAENYYTPVLSYQLEDMIERLGYEPDGLHQALDILAKQTIYPQSVDSIVWENIDGKGYFYMLRCYWGIERNDADRFPLIVIMHTTKELREWIVDKIEDDNWRGQKPKED